MVYIRDVVVGSYQRKKRREHSTKPEHDGIGRAGPIEQGANGR
jgi:hypothetical protein